MKANTLLMSPKKRYFYSKALGFVEETNNKKSQRIKFSDSKDLALIAHYKKIHNKLEKSKEKKQEQINELNSELFSLDAEFEYLKDMYPEEFV